MAANLVNFGPVTPEILRLICMGGASAAKIRYLLVLKVILHVVLMLCDFSLRSDEYDMFKTCEILVWLKIVLLRYSSMIVDPKLNEIYI